MIFPTLNSNILSQIYCTFNPLAISKLTKVSTNHRTCHVSSVLDLEFIFHGMLLTNLNRRIKFTAINKSLTHPQLTACIQNPSPMYDK